MSFRICVTSTMIELSSENSLQLKAVKHCVLETSLEFRIDPNTKYVTKRDVKEAYSECVHTSEVELFCNNK